MSSSLLSLSSSSPGRPELQQPASPLGESRSFSYLGLRIAQYALLFVATIIITRKLGPVGRAQYALPLAVSGGVWVSPT